MSHPSSKPTSDRQDFQRRLQRIEVLVNAVETAFDPRIRAAMLELMQTLLELHGTALERMLEIVFETGPAGRELIDRFGADHLTSGVLLLHGLHPLDLETRVHQGIAQVRPAVQTAGGDIELLSLVEGIVKVRLEGDFHGSLTTAKAIKNLVEETILQAAPDVTGVDVIGSFGLPEGSGLVQLGRAVSRNGNISN